MAKKFDWWDVIKNATKDSPASHKKRKRAQDKAVKKASKKK